MSGEPRPMRDGGGRAARTGPSFPADGPIDSALGYLLFYVLVDRATPTIVDVATDILPVSPSLVGTALAALLWFVLATTLLDQGRRQLAALGVVGSDARRRSRRLSGRAALTHLVVVLVGGAVAWLTVDRALATAVALIPIVTRLDASAFPVADIVVLVVFFVAFGVATHSLDRLVFGSIRNLLGD